jgi:proteasome lid subunit RPN8/RPN11
VTLAARAEAAIVQHARAAAPEECCGLLLGRRLDIVEAVAARNTSPQPLIRYTVEPRDYFAAIRLARSRNLEIIGAYHSHPRHSARPSATDAAEAIEDFIFVIVSLAAEPPDLRAWHWLDGNFAALPIVRVS